MLLDLFVGKLEGATSGCISFHHTVAMDSWMDISGDIPFSNYAYSDEKQSKKMFLQIFFGSYPRLNFMLLPFDGGK